MHHKNQERLSRKLVWVEGESIGGWGCSECAWAFNPSVPPPAETLDELTRKLQPRLWEEFAAHVCADQSGTKSTMG
jgi:hypothetical protein